jgi:hypothetical protein
MAAHNDTAGQETARRPSDNAARGTARSTNSGADHASGDEAHVAAANSVERAVGPAVAAATRESRRLQQPARGTKVTVCAPSGVWRHTTNAGFPLTCSRR